MEGRPGRLRKLANLRVSKLINLYWRLVFLQSLIFIACALCCEYRINIESIIIVASSQNKLRLSTLNFRIFFECFTHSAVRDFVENRRLAFTCYVCENQFIHPQKSCSEVFNSGLSGLEEFYYAYAPPLRISESFPFGRNLFPEHSPFDVYLPNCCRIQFGSSLYPHFSSRC